MEQPLLLIPDISGFTRFIKSTEIEHSVHVISELLQVLVDANVSGLELAEVEGDALFFYKEKSNLSQVELLAQIERMFTAFHSHLDRFDKLRICTCQACSTAPDLELKIVAHTGSFQFIKVQNMRKPFGPAVIDVHRLLKNSVQSNNYVIITDALAKNIDLSTQYQSNLFRFEDGSDQYDGDKIVYLSSIIDATQLELTPIEKESGVNLDAEPNLQFTKLLPVSADEVLEVLSNYRYRQHWISELDRIEYDENEVTRVGSAHLCVVDGKKLDFLAIATDATEGQLSYGEVTKSPPMVDELIQIFQIEKLTDQTSRLRLKVYFKAANPIKRLMLALIGKRMLKKQIQKTLDLLEAYLSSQASDGNRVAQ